MTNDWNDRLKRMRPPVFCKHCGSRLMPRPGLQPQQFDEYTGHPVPPERSCTNPMCRQLVSMVEVAG